MGGWRECLGCRERAEGWGSDFQRGAVGVEIANRCDSADKRGNLDKSRLCRRSPASPLLCLPFSILSLSQGRGRGEEVGGREAGEGASFIFRDFSFSF